GDCLQPPRFAFAEPPTPLEKSYAVGTTLLYRCRSGYTRAEGKSAKVTCGVDSLWSADPDFCIGGSCGPPDIMNGNFNYTTNLLFGATITYTCNVGYRLHGQPSAQCVFKDNEVYWDAIPHCAIILCLPPPVIENGQLINGDTDFTFGMVATYSCKKGFALIGDATIHCDSDDNLNGVWSSPAPECKVVRCKNPEVKNGRRLSGFGPEHTYKNTVTFECNPGHLLNGSDLVTCEADNTWKPPLPTCDPRQQCTPPTIDNGDVIADNFLFETVVTFTCHPGPPTIDNGMHNGTKGIDFVHGSTVAYECNDGFTLVGGAFLQCGANVIIVGAAVCAGDQSMVLIFALRLLGSSALLLATASGARATHCPFPHIQYGKRVSVARNFYRTGDT
ncbi:PREDICTED: complement component receptor 1-like protein, partial [Fulmarus glacialis]|uniref:complement component receptor 1-like protein n=1 Tax=Fulmarus glacialis TaxID=30455 RepID=UPI00051C26CB